MLVFIDYDQSIDWLVSNL